MAACPRCSREGRDAKARKLCRDCRRRIRDRAAELCAASVRLRRQSVGLQFEASARLRRPLGPVFRRPSRSPAADDQGGTALAGLRILVVDDDPDVRDALDLLLTDLGARVTGARDGIEALAHAEQMPPDVILCDLRMPGLDGFGFLRRLRRDPHRARIPVIAVSALASAADRQRTQTAGFDAHLAKPFDVAQLLSALTTARGRATA